MRTTRRRATFDVYASWFVVNFVTGLVPIVIIRWLHNSALPNSATRDIISAFLAYMATLLLASLYFDASQTGFQRMRRACAELLVICLYFLYVLYNWDLNLHQGVNGNAGWVLCAIYLLCVTSGFFLNRELLDGQIKEQLVRKPLEEADKEAKAVKGMRDQLEGEG